MVSVRRDRRGASTIGCLLSLLVLVAVLYYGVNIGEVYFRYYRILDEMQSQARVAAALDNGTIQRRIASAIQEIALPDDASSNLQITRSASPRQITIETEYAETVKLPLFVHTFHLHPKATEPL
ncbi:MAG TPA: hypothetical protein VKB45_17515 [Gemmatimonadales bacterium]|nr:hypothetical protein [Gemmatimonadales bacterium]